MGCVPNCDMNFIEAIALVVDIVGLVAVVAYTVKHRPKVNTSCCLSYTTRSRFASGFHGEVSDSFLQNCLLT